MNEENWGLRVEHDLTMLASFPFPEMGFTSAGTPARRVAQRRQRSLGIKMTGHDVHPIPNDRGVCCEWSGRYVIIYLQSA